MKKILYKQAEFLSISFLHSDPKKFEKTLDKPDLLCYNIIC